MEDTIVALATPEGRSALALIRVSGPKAIESVNEVFKNKDLSKVDSHTIHYGWIYDGEDPIDEVLVFVMRGPRTYTGEDMVEITCHGSPLIIRKIIRTLQKHGARPAMPGEFTFRAFMNRKIDLLQAEAINDLINATSEEGYKVALKHLRGDVSKAISQLREKLLNLTSLIELELDFSEEDVEFASREELLRLIREIRRIIKNLLETYETGMALKEGIKIAIVGNPNAGKSTILNALVKEERAIVSDIPGTTRDYIEETFSLEGYLFRVIDTAGIRQTTDPIEKIGVERTMEQLQKAHLTLYVYDITEMTPEEVCEHIKSLPISGDVLIIANKKDLVKDREIKLPDCYPTLLISAKDPEDIERLRQTLINWAKEKYSSEGIVLTSERQYNYLKLAYEAITEAEQGILNNLPQDLVASSLRAVIDYLGELTGDITTEDILGNIFANFCIGK
ncbi:MAG: tRNA uridine-5-carboxymethylaminomethyl(34) synthesis GTPase MnmE [Chlorobi bacterium]|nr:tRNA uridine-5-carboxymethylaminomethyl(34) synthesis GTPase MnmE [Chlorobiota bacterium]